MYYNKLTGFADEISPRVEEQFQGLNKLNIKYFEPRFVDSKNISDLTDDELASLKSNMDKYGIKVSSIGSPIGKLDISDDFNETLRLLKNVINAAHVLGTKYIRVFSFYNKNGEWDAMSRQIVFDQTAKMIDLATQEDVILLHENEKEIYGDTAERTLDLMKNFYGPHYKAVFDPANFVQCNEDTKKAYEMLKPYIEYMHIKDAKLTDGSVTPSGYGDGNVEYILTDLFKHGYDGFLSLEPHLGSFEGFADLENGGSIQTTDKSDFGKFQIAYQALYNILEKIIS